MSSIILYVIIILIWIVESFQFSKGNTAYIDIIGLSVLFSFIILALISLIYSIILVSKGGETLTAFILPVIPVIASLLMLLLFNLFWVSNIDNWGLVEGFILIATIIFLIIAVVVNSIILVVRKIKNKKNSN